MGNTLLNELKGTEFYSFDPQLEPEQVITNYLFNHPNHLSLQAKANWKIFGLKINGRPVLQLALHIKKKEAQSPLKAPFGSLQSKGRITSGALNFFIKNTEAWLRADGCRKMMIKHYPEAYQMAATRLLYNNLRALGFRTRAEISSIIGVDKINFEKKIKISERQKLRKSRSTFRFQQVPMIRLTEVYRFIEACRHQKEYSLSMALAKLQETVKRFKNDFFLFGVYENETLAAATIVIRVNKEILYTFYFDHASRFNKISPIVFLMSGIYSFAQQNHYRMIDLGTSMNGNEVNKPLLHFKESIGGRPSPKYIFEKAME